MGNVTSIKLITKAALCPAGGRVVLGIRAFPFLLLYLLLTLPLVALEQEPPWHGKCVSVSDGHTIGVIKDEAEVKIRLQGICCPESAQPFGNNPKQSTSQRVFGKTVEVHPLEMDRYGRTIAWVLTPERSLNAALVEKELAWWYREYAKDNTILKDLEEKARKAEIGLWQDKNPIAPWEWRKGGRDRGKPILPAPAVVAPNVLQHVPVPQAVPNLKQPPQGPNPNRVHCPQIRQEVQLKAELQRVTQC